jgi:hypothetical protein
LWESGRENLAADFAILWMLPVRIIDLCQKEFIFLQVLRNDFDRKEGGNESFVPQGAVEETKKQ